MKKNIPVILFAFFLTITLSQCFNKTTPSVSKPVEPKLTTHKEAVDSLMIDSSAPRKPLIIKELKGRDGLAILTQSNLTQLIINEYPIQGFYGEDRYRIEFKVDEVKRDSADARIYHVKGRNRHKKVITNFEGIIQLNGISELIDPNLDTAETTDLYYIKMYAAKGTFTLKEDSTLNTSGIFKGTINIDFATKVDGTNELWFFSPETPAKGSGAKYDGTWVSYNKEKPTPKPVVWAADLFQFANDILTEFSMGERDVEINPKYRHLGWADFWENDEWWNNAAKDEKEKVKM